MLQENFVTLSAGETPLAVQSPHNIMYPSSPKKTMTLVDISDLNLYSCLNTTKIAGREELSDRSDALPETPDRLTPDTKPDTAENIVKYFRTKIEEIPNKSTAESRQKAFNAFLTFAGNDNLTADTFSETSIIEWATWLISNGYTPKTVDYYIKQLGTLYNQAATDRIAQQTDAFSTVRKQLAAIPTDDFAAMPPDTADRLQKFTTEWAAGRAAKNLATDIVAFAILNGGMTFPQIADYKKTDYQGHNELLRAIVDKYAKPRNKYLFPLDQSLRTPSQIKKQLGKLFYIALTPYGLAPSKTEETTATDLWSLAAVHNGVAPRTLLGMTKGHTPSFNPVLRLLQADAVTPEEATAIQQRLIATLTANPTNWYAMQFRPRVSFEQIKQALDAIKNDVHCNDLFYPSEEIMRRTGRKMIKEQKPVIPGLLFFKSRSTDIPTIFRHIGALAWCYRQTGEPTSPYAVIPAAQIQAYQTIIGQFTPDMELLPEDSTNIKENDRVIILGGSLVGQTATVTGIKTSEGGRTIYKLSLIGNNSVEWTVTTDSRLFHQYHH